MNSALGRTSSHRTRVWVEAAVVPLVAVWQLSGDTKGGSFSSSCCAVLNVLAFCLCPSCLVSSRSVTCSPLAAREAGEGII